MRGLVNKADHVNFDTILKIFLKQIEMLSVLFIENLRWELDDFDDAKQQKKVSKNYLMKQSINLQGWIVKLKSFSSFLKSNKSKSTINFKSISATPRDLASLKSKIDTEVENMNRNSVSIPKTASKFPTPSPAAKRTLKNEPLFVSSMLPNQAVLQKTYFGDKLSSK